MDHAENPHTTNPSGVTLTRKGERAVHQQAMARSLAIAEKKRIWLEAGEEIERLMTILDRLDGDPDLEPSLGYTPPGYEPDTEQDQDDEFSLGWTGAVNQAGRGFCGENTDSELDRCDYEDTGDLEDGVDDEDNGDATVCAWPEVLP